MPTLNQNSLSSLSVFVSDIISVADVFGALRRQTVRIILYITGRTMPVISKLKGLLFLFSNLNNHSSPPVLTLNESLKIARTL